MIAVFAKDQDLISADLYASIVLAVLISTIIPPFALRFTLSYYNKIAARMIKQAEDLERQRATTIDASLGLTREEQEKRLRVSLFSSLYFLCSVTDTLTYHYLLNTNPGKYRGKQDCLSLYSNSMWINLGTHP